MFEKRALNFPLFFSSCSSLSDTVAISSWSFSLEGDGEEMAPRSDVTGLEENGGGGGGRASGRRIS